MSEIYTASYPRSGATWLNRLLSDLLKSPLQATPEEDPEWFGEKGGEFVIRKTHCREWEAEDRQLTDDAVWIFLQRDPRDVVISRLFYANITSIRKAINEMVMDHDNDPWERGNYDAMIRPWMESDRPVYQAHYELLHTFALTELQAIIKQILGMPLPLNWVRAVIQRQSFGSVRATHGPRFDHSMRRGRIGDWKQYFNRDDGEFMQNSLGMIMCEMGYEDDPDWWKELPDRSVKKWVPA